ncbi:peptidase M23 [Ornithobacterium rhinotracheale]|uniref:murein hydrolase activator EnvC family protein n=1 Tax=Ornithobacterium rhinotracheale TaxID=28251 RepID=UPI00129D018D|nr:peptidoglycan DD-metalloendopeptidase family protein [Ornithobacterium rhinotracheale]MRI62675.1 peptidase M23 [Ornithobacterium rhinotracheale]
MKKLILFILLLCVGIGNAQYNKEKLRRESRALQNQIAKLNKSLNQTRSESKKSILYLKQLKDKISAQNQLVNTTAKEKQAIDDEIYLSQLAINKYKRELTELKKEYKSVLVNAYVNKSLQNKVLFILSARNFTEAFRRIEYLEKYSGFQGQKAEEISQKQAAIEKEKAQQQKARNEKEVLLAQREVLKENMLREQEEQNKILAEFKKNENEISAQIKDKEKQNKALEAKIQAIIQEEIRIAKAKAEAERKAREEAARKERERLARLEAERKAKAEAERKAAIAAAKAKAREEGKNQAAEVAKVEKKYEEINKAAEKKSSTEVAKTYENRSANEALSSNFSSNRGRLPWPVSSGEIVGRFGTQPHPLLPQTTVNNAGVKIATKKGSAVRAVFDGVVSHVISIQGGNKAVMISHGNYFTVYNNLSSVNVSQGQKVSTKQTIGTVFTDPDNNTILDFQIWNGTSKQNPASWISGM